MAEKTDKGFTVKDKRSFTSKGESKEPLEETPHDEPRKQETAAQPESEHPVNESQPPLPEINFSTFILSLSSSALFHFGELPDPVTNQKQQNLPMAKQTIDILGILQEKTSGNLTEEESKLLENLLYDLRMRYVTESEKEKSNK